VRAEKAAASAIVYEPKGEQVFSVGQRPPIQGFTARVVGVSASGDEIAFELEDGRRIRYYAIPYRVIEA
jgi:hypothetical protein